VSPQQWRRVKKCLGFRDPILVAISSKSRRQDCMVSSSVFWRGIPTGSPTPSTSSYPLSFGQMRHRRPWSPKHCAALPQASHRYRCFSWSAMLFLWTCFSLQYFGLKWIVPCRGSKITLYVFRTYIQGSIKYSATATSPHSLSLLLVQACTVQYLTIHEGRDQNGEEFVTPLVAVGLHCNLNISSDLQHQCREHLIWSTTSMPRMWPCYYTCCGLDGTRPLALCRHRHQQYKVTNEVYQRSISIIKLP